MKKIVLTCTTLWFLMSGCNQTKKVVPEPPPAVLSGIFTVVSINGQQISSKAVLEFNKADKRIWGNAGCNDFSATYTQNASSIKIGQLSSTKAYCDGAMKNEYAIQKALKNVGSFNVSSTSLTLYSITEKKPLLKGIKNKE